MASLGTLLGQTLAAAAPALAVLTGCVELVPLGTFEWEEFEGRSTTTPMPVAPPPPQGDHVIDLVAREIGATRTSGSEVPAHPETVMHPLRTDAALDVHLSPFLGVRALGSLGYGSPIGAAAPSPFADRPTASGGLGALLGWWGDRDWSIQLALDLNLVLLQSRDRYTVVTGSCFEARPRFFGTRDVRCFREVVTDEVRTYGGAHVVPTFGATLDVAGWPVRWLRIGAGASVQEYVSRAASGDIHHQFVGIARVFVEAHIDDVWLGLEAQQWVIENVNFAPALAVTIGGVAFERAEPRSTAETSEPSAPGSAPAALGWDGLTHDDDAAEAAPSAAPRRRPQRAPLRPTDEASP